MGRVKRGGGGGGELTVGEVNRKAFAERLRAALGERSGRSVALATGGEVSPTAMNQYLAGQSEPTRPVLIRLAKELGVSVQWLATGEGPERMRNDGWPILPDGEPAPPPPIDEELMARIYEGISTAYKEVNARISPADQGRLAAHMLNRLVTIYNDPEDRLVGLKMALEDLRERLRQAPVPGESSGKRSA